LRLPTPIAIAIGLIALVIAMAIGSGTASAATTRAEWVAQVDPICQSAQLQEGIAGELLGRATRRFKKESRKNNDKAERQLARAFRSYQFQYIAIERGVNTQIAAVPPAPEDVSLVQVWLRARGELLDEETQLYSGGLKPKQQSFKGFAQLFSQFFTLIGREYEVTDLVRDFGFRYCNTPQQSAVAISFVGK
jgi:hypothetical protein